MARIFEYYSEGDNNKDTINSSSVYRGQTFEPQDTFTCTSIKLKMYKSGSPGTVTIGIQGTSSSLPDNSYIASESYDTSSLTTDTNGEWVEITLSSPVELSASTIYAIVIQAPSADGSNILYPRLRATAGIYPFGNRVTSNNGGSSWSADTTADFMFELWGTESVPLGEHWSQGTDGIVLYDDSGVTGNYYVNGQTFISSVDFSISSVAFKLRKTGNGCGNITAYLYAVDGSHHPTGSALSTSAAIDSSTITTAANGQLVKFTFGTSFTCVAGTEYAIYMYPDGGNGSNYITAFGDLASPCYLAGARLYSNNGGSTWSWLTGADLTFRTYGSTEPELKDFYFGQATGLLNVANNHANDWMAQTWTPFHTQYRLSVIAFYIYKGSGDNVGTVEVEIYATDSNGHPTGTALATGTIDDADIPTVTGQWVACTLDSTVDVSPGTKYAVVLHSDSCDASNLLYWNADDISSISDYPNGDSLTSTNGGSTWVADTTQDFLFKTFGGAVPSATYWRIFITQYMPAITPHLATVKCDDLTASRLVATDSDQTLASTDIINWITGTANQVIATDDTDGTLTLSLPQDIDTGADFVAGSLTASALTLTGFTGILWSNAGTISSDGKLNDLANPDGDKTFNMTTRQLTFLWTNPAGNPLELEASGAYTGSLLHIHQHTGNPGSCYLLSLEATDADVEHIGTTGAATTTHILCSYVSGDTEERFVLHSDGAMEWGAGGVTAVDTNLYRSAANVLKTDDAFTAVGAITGASLVIGDAGTIGSASDTDAISISAAGVVSLTVQGIADNQVLTVDAADAADNEYARFTANGLESRTAAEVLADLAPTYTTISGNDVNTDVTGAELEELTDGSVTALHSHAGGAGAFTSRFEAYRTSSQSINSGSFIKVQLNNEGFDGDGEFDNATNYRFTAGANGYYMFDALVKIESLADNKALQIGLYVDGTTYYSAAKTHYNGAAGTHVFVCASRLVYLAQNSYVELYIYHNHGSALNIEGNRYMCYLTGHRIS